MSGQHTEVNKTSGRERRGNKSIYFNYICMKYGPLNLYIRPIVISLIISRLFIYLSLTLTNPQLYPYLVHVYGSIKVPFHYSETPCASIFLLYLIINYLSIALFKGTAKDCIEKWD